MTTTTGSRRTMIAGTITSPEHQTEVRTTAVVVAEEVIETGAGGSAGEDREAGAGDVEAQGFY